MHLHLRGGKSSDSSICEKTKEDKVRITRVMQLRKEFEYFMFQLLMALVIG